MTRAAVAPLALATLLAAMSPGPATATEPRVEVIEFGVFATGPARRVPHPQSISGEMNLVSGARLLRRAKVLAAQPGRSFGWRYRVHGLAPGAVVTLRTLHPPLTNPETGRTMRYSERSLRLANPEAPRYTGYTFDYSWEMAEGIWRFQILHRGRLIGERRFKVLVPLN